MQGRSAWLTANEDEIAAENTTRLSNPYGNQVLRIVSDGIWTEIEKLTQGGPAKFAAIAYVTSEVHLKFGRGDVLVCDATDNAISSGQTSAEVLRRTCARGTKVYSSPGLHAKAIVVGRIAIVGSANMSASSASTLDEAAIFTDDARAVAGVRMLVAQLAEEQDQGSCSSPGSSCLLESFVGPRDSSRQTF